MMMEDHHFFVITLNIVMCPVVTGKKQHVWVHGNDNGHVIAYTKDGLLEVQCMI